MPQFFDLAIRVDGSADDFLAYLDRRSESGFCVREYADSGEHVHALLRTRVKPNSFRVLLKREVSGLAGNGSYSVAEVKDYEKYVRYCCKGEFDGSGVDIVWRNGLEWTDERLWDEHCEYWLANRATKKRAVGSVLDHTIDVCKAEGIAWDDFRTIGKEYIKELGARSKLINLFAVKSAVNLVSLKLCPDDRALESLVDRL